MPHSRDLILANLLRFRHCPISRTGTLLKRRGKSSCQIYRLRFQRRAIEDSKAKNKCHLTVVILASVLNRAKRAGKDLASERSQRMGRAPDRLRGLTERAHEAAAHALTIAKSCFNSDSFYRQAPLFEHQPSCFQSQVLNSLRRRQAGLRTKHPGELPGAEAGCIS